MLYLPWCYSSVFITQTQPTARPPSPANSYMCPLRLAMHLKWSTHVSVWKIRPRAIVACLDCWVSFFCPQVSPIWVPYCDLRNTATKFLDTIVKRNTTLSPLSVTVLPEYTSPGISKSKPLFTNMPFLWGLTTIIPWDCRHYKIIYKDILTFYTCHKSGWASPLVHLLDCCEGKSSLWVPSYFKSQESEWSPSTVPVQSWGP